MSVKVSRVRTRVPVSTSLPDLPVHVDSVSVRINKISQIVGAIDIRFKRYHWLLLSEALNSF